MSLILLMISLEICGQLEFLQKWKSATHRVLPVIQTAAPHPLPQKEGVGTPPQLAFAQQKHGGWAAGLCKDMENQGL
jgi:hypothetical protein